MVVLLTLSLLLLASLVMIVLRLTGRPPSFAWLAAALGSLLTWAGILFWLPELPLRLPLTSWTPVSLFSASPELLIDSYAWVYALSLGALAVAVILTSPARLVVLSPVSWIAALLLALTAILAVMADNVLTLALAWTAIDLLEILNTLRLSNSSTLTERAVISFAFRAFGTGFALWSAVLSAASGQLTTLEATPPQAGLYMLLAVGLRLGVLPLHLAYREDPALRRGIGSFLRLTAAATSLVVLARLPAESIDPNSLPYLLALIALAALYAGWKWLTLPDEISARPHWLIGMSALSLAAALRGSQAGSAAWGVALVLFGGLSFLYSARQVWFTRFFAGLAVLMLALPFSMTAIGWAGDFPLPSVFWPLFLLAHAMLVAGYLRHLFRPGETSFGELPRWAQVAYPVGLGIFVVTMLLVGLVGWPGSQQVGAWWFGAGWMLLAGLGALLYWRMRHLFAARASSPGENSTRRVSYFAQMQEAVAGLLWGLYRTLGRLLDYLSNLLEGDGGLLWTLLLLVLFITILRGR